MTDGVVPAANDGQQTDVRLIPFDGHQLAVQFSDGSGPNVAFIHGITGDVTFWENVTPEGFKARTRWASFSLPCHAPSTAPDDFGMTDVSPRLFADLIANGIRDVFKGEPVHLVGWSTGGFSALTVSACHPDLVASVTSIAGFVRGNWGSTLGMMQRIALMGSVGRIAFSMAMKSLARGEGTFRTVFSAFAANSNSIRSNSDFLSSLIHLRDGLSKLDFKLMACLFGALRKIDASQLARNIVAPTLLIGGVEDPIIRISETRHVASLLQNAELVELSDCGHLFYCEAGEQIWPRVEEWIQTHG